MQQPTPYPELNGVLAHFVSALRRALGDAFVGAYLQGSFAVGDFDEHSDADFIIVVRDELAFGDVEQLQRLHHEIFDLPAKWAKHLEGSYFPEAILRRQDAVGTSLWYLDHGSNSLVRSTHCNTLLVRSVLRERGITLEGPPPIDLLDAVSPRALGEETRKTMTGWAREILRDPEPYRNRFYQGFIVLSYARMLHDLTAGRPGSKRAGAEWAKSALDPEWRDLIDRAWATRANPALSVRERANAADFERSLEFMQVCVRAAFSVSSLQ